ncbi:MAG: hypothetical protein GX307_03960 [Euryarchaeota archaeon]|nr:hypothetical protein [Euryarchaeota archaeon]
MKRIGWFTTARGPGSYGLFKAIISNIESGELDARLSFVFINRDIKGNEYRMKIIQMAEERGIPVIILPSDAFMPDLKARDVEAWRNAYGRELRDRISPYGMDFGVLAGYMLIVDPQTCHEHVLINLHPALPDTYKGTWKEIVTRVAKSSDHAYGATVHLCSPILDCGDAIAYDSFELDELRKRTPREELPDAIRAKEVAREIPLLMESIRLLVNEDITVREGTLLDRQGKRLASPLDLSDRITALTGEK